MSTGLAMALLIGAIVAATIASGLIAGAFGTGVGMLIRKLVNRPDKDFERYRNGS